MAVREFNIPFGPDKTGGLGLEALADEREGEVKDPFAEPPVGAYARATGQELAGLPDEPELEDIEEFFDAPAEEPQRDAASLAAPRSWEQEPAETDRAVAVPEDEDYDDERPTSFAALRDSIGQSRELKARERELDEFSEQLRLDSQELADREDILEHYESLVAEQDRLIREATEIREQDKAELAAVAQDIEDIDRELAEMREFHNSKMQPLESELGRARASAEQAKNDERSRKSELNAAEAELRKGASSPDAVMLQARVDQFSDAYDRARSVAAEAQDILDEVKRIYDDAVSEVESREKPLEHSIRDLEEREAQLKESIAQLGDEISIARKRRQYCDSVYSYPDETRKLRQNVEADEATLQDMQLDYDELSDLLAQTKAHARKAKAALILGAIAVVAIVCLIVFVVRPA